jgi:hypothetical protein
MYTRWIGRGSGWLLDKIVAIISATGVNPNILSYLGLFVTGWAAVLLGRGNSAGGGGDFSRRVLRPGRRPGGAADEAGDDVWGVPRLRCSTATPTCCSTWESSSTTPGGAVFYVILAAWRWRVVHGELLRARAESIDSELQGGGFAERPERLVLLILGGAF